MKVKVLAEHEGWLMLESENGEWYFGLADGKIAEEPADCPIAILMKKAKETRALIN
jgi:hypothetical protein